MRVRSLHKCYLMPNLWGCMHTTRATARICCAYVHSGGRVSVGKGTYATSSTVFCARLQHCNRSSFLFPSPKNQEDASSLSTCGGNTTFSRLFWSFHIERLGLTALRPKWKITTACHHHAHPRLLRAICPPSTRAQSHTRWAELLSVFHYSTLFLALLFSPQSYEILLLYALLILYLLCFSAKARPCPHGLIRHGLRLNASRGIVATALIVKADAFVLASHCHSAINPQTLYTG